MQYLIELHETFAQAVHFITVDYCGVSVSRWGSSTEPYCVALRPVNVQLDVDTMLSNSWVVPTEPLRRCTWCMAAVLGSAG